MCIKARVKLKLIKIKLNSIIRYIKHYHFSKIKGGGFNIILYIKGMHKNIFHTKNSIFLKE